MSEQRDSTCSVGEAVTLACLLEATAPKVGNVHRGADFDDLGFADFAISAAVIGPIAAEVSRFGVGRTILECVRRTQAFVATNTNLGIVLLVVPLAAAKPGDPTSIRGVLADLEPQDGEAVYAAIAEAQPGGLGEADAWDVNRGETPASLLDAMRAAADRDLIARQYATDFELVFRAADELAGLLSAGEPLEQAIVISHLKVLAENPDTLIARKCGLSVAQQASDQAAAALELRPDPDAFWRDVGNLDFWMRCDGHRRNPGATADIVAAALFTLLREQRLERPLRTEAALRRLRGRAN